MKGQRKMLPITKLVMGRGTDPDRWVGTSIPISSIREISDFGNQSTMEPWSLVKTKITTTNETYHVTETRDALTVKIETPYDG